MEILMSPSLKQVLLVIHFALDKVVGWFMRLQNHDLTLTCLLISSETQGLKI